MSSIMDATPGKILVECASCRRMQPTCCCFCDIDICDECTPKHLGLCHYAKARLFRTWKPEAGKLK